MDGPSTYDYKVLKGPWGIRVRLTAEVRPRSDAHQAAVPVDHGIRLVRGSGGGHLGDEDVAALVTGLAMVADGISAAVDGAHVDVVIHSVSYQETDFQVEGLTAAAAGWAVARFGLPVWEPAVAFDRAANRYTFAWPEPRGR